MGETYARRVSVWLGLLALAQLADLVTTGADMARGSVEAVQPSANLIATGGLSLLWVVKFALVLAAALTTWLTLRLAERSAARPAHVMRRTLMTGVQVAVIALTGISLNNTLVLVSLVQGS